MIVINKTDIESLNISTTDCLKWVEQSFLLKKDCQLPAKMSVHPIATDFITTMPCLLPANLGKFGVKVVSRINGRTPTIKSELLLYNSINGDLLALMDCDWITTMRTSAVATLAIKTLRRTNSLIYSFIGLGCIGNATIKCLIENSLEECFVIRLFRYKNHAEKIINQFKSYENITFEVADTIEELVKNADVIVSCITEANGLLVEDDSLFKEGVLVVPVHTRGFQNCDLFFDKVYADDKAHVCNFKYFNKFRKFAEFGDVLVNSKIGRESENERILSYNIGLGLHDVFFANKIFNKINVQK